ncbi:MAG: MFS transporter, partial [Pseudomonadota bacterium]
QTSSSAGMVLSRAIVRDVYPREKSASMIGYVVMGMAIAPMIGPAIGGYIDSVAGWRWSFAMLGAFGAVALVSTWASLPETNTFAGQSAATQLRAYKTILTMPLFWLYVASASLASAVFFGFLGGGPAVSSVFFQQTPFQYGLYFSLCAVGYAAGNGLAGRFSEAVGVARMMYLGALVTLLGPALSLCLFMLFADPAPWMLFVPLALVGLGNGMTLPNVTAATISLRTEAAGAASGMLGSLQIGSGAVASVIGAIVVGETGSPVALCILLTGFGIAALIATFQAARQS